MGRIWMWHAVEVFIVLFITNVMIWLEIRNPGPYLLLGATGLLLALYAPWYYRFRLRIPLTPIERQLGQVWALAFVAFVLTGIINHLMGLETLRLLPVVILECGLAFGCTAVILGGEFYLMAAACTALAMFHTVYPSIGPLVFGTAFAIGMSIPAWKYSRTSRR